MLQVRVEIFLTLLFSAFSIGTPNCGYSSCHPTKDGYINVHVIAHTHDDLGWVRTVDQYYYDRFMGVRRILTSSFEALRKDGNRRFMYVESAFLFKWWSEQTPLVKKQFKQLIENGQLELVSGAWSMNDEATTNYQSIIDQFTLGLSKINDTFGACGRPRIGWQIDSFGHSNEMASIFAQLGFDGLFLGRIDYQDKKNRFATKTAEMIWEGSKSLGKKSHIFTTILFNLYWAPAHFCVDALCGWPFGERLVSQWTSLVQFMTNQARGYRTNNIILTMGGDFHFSQAQVNFKRLDQLIQFGNDKQGNGSKFHFIYSTPSCYLKAVHIEAAQAQIKWPIVVDDFFPYASTKSRYWTGFYTSRPTLKRFERTGNNFLQVCKQLSVLGNLKNGQLQKTESLKRAMGVLQHHDAISGTEKQHVANDYSKLLGQGLDDCANVSSESLNKLLLSNPLDRYNIPDFPFTSCLLANISQCAFTELSDNFVVTVYNPLSRPVDHYVRIPVNQGVYSVKGPNDSMPPLQMVPIPKQVLEIPGRQSSATVELVFPALQVPPLGFKSYYVRKNPEDKIYNNMWQSYGDKKVTIRLDNKTGLLSHVSVKNQQIPIRQEFLFYEGTSKLPRPSGAYVFRPANAAAKTLSDNAKVKTHFGAVLTEIHQTFNEWVSQVIKVYHDESYVELQWLVGPLPNDYKPREVISRFTTNLKSHATFYTDSNGREMQRRVRNLRPTFELNISEPVSSNYYPVTSKILIRDPVGNLEVAVLTDRSEGGTSLKDGQIELLVHRNSIKDDGLGVEERLREQAFGKPLVVRGSHYLVAGHYINFSGDTLASVEKDLSQRKLLEAWTFLSPTKQLSYHDYSTLHKLEYSGLNSGLPKNVQILTLEPWSKLKLLLRLEHVFEINEDPVWSKPAIVDVENLFKAFKVVNLRETTLGGNQWLDENKPMRFMSKGRPSFEVNLQRILVRKGITVNDNRCGKEGGGSGGKFKICLVPMQIRTFIVQIKRNV